MITRVAGIGLTGLVFAAAALSQPRVLKAGGDIQVSISQGEVHTYPLDLAGGQIVRMFFTRNPPFEITVKLAAPDGQTLMQRTSRNNLLFSALAAAAGRYTLEVSVPQKAAPAAGQYNISHIEIRAATPADEALLKADATYSEFSRAPAASVEAAATQLDAVASLYAQAGEPDFEAWSMLLAGQYRVRLSDFKRAVDGYARAAAAFQEAGNGAGQARALDSLGQTYILIRDYPKAIEAASQALSLSRAKHLQSIEAGSLSTLGGAYSQMGQSQRALEFVEEALKLARSLGDRVREAAALGSASGLHTTLGNYEKALEFRREALAIYRASGDRRAEAATLANMGGAYGYMGQPAKAIEYFEPAIVIFRTAEGSRLALATTLSNCGQAYLSTHQPAKAVPVLEEALAVFRQMESRWDEVYTLATLGRARHAMNDLSGAATILATALSMGHENDDPRVEACTRLDLARLERTRGNLEAAREQIAAAIDVVESQRNRVAVPDLRASLVASIGEYYELHVDILMQLYRESGSTARLEEARAAAERARARNLLDVLAAAGIRPDASSDPELVARERKLREGMGELSRKRTGLLRVKSSPEQMANIDKRIDEAWTDYQAARSKLIASDPRAASLADPSALTLETIHREVLDPDTLLLEYSLGKERSYLWAVSQDAIHGFDLPQRARIEEAALVFWDAVKAGLDAASVERAASRLSSIVLAPAGRLLERKRLVIVADGALQYVPFAALADPAQPRAFRPLILTHEVVNEPSASTLALLRRGEAGRKAAGQALAVFADPVFDADDPRLRQGSRTAESAAPQPAFLTRAAELRLARLPSTRQEGRSIASLAPEPQRWLALDFDASRAAATSSRLSDYRIVHFATHGVIESARPELSALALSLFDAQGKPQDGFLRLYEIYNLKIQADLVVLSACQTALGKNVRGEGLVGLARGFMHAGAPRVVASLWKVDDQATGELMRLFYAAMLGPQKKPAAAALRSAQLAVAGQERWRSPYYWAAFVLQGDWR
jgi:CHAT domain-containing protein